jgi:hypothetical protein
VYQKGKNKLLMIIILVGGLFELIFAITSGARELLYFIFDIFLVDYYFRQRIKILWVAVFGLVLYISMTMIAKYKDYVFTTSNNATEVSNPIVHRIGHKI